MKAGGGLIAVGALCLGAFSWRTRTILAGLLAAAALAFVAYVFAAGLSGGSARVALVFAAIALVVGTVLYVLGQALERLLDTDPPAGSGHPHED